MLPSCYEDGEILHNKKKTKEEMVDNHDNEFKEIGYFENDYQK
jgi:hypothetical protein